MPGRARVVFKWKVLHITPGLRRGRLYAQPSPVLPGQVLRAYRPSSSRTAFSTAIDSSL